MKALVLINAEKLIAQVFSTAAFLRSHRSQLIGVSAAQDRHRAETGRDAHDVIIMNCAGSGRLISITYLCEFRR